MNRHQLPFKMGGQLADRQPCSARMPLTSSQ
jgi:hypothetical protein